MLKICVSDLDSTFKGLFLNLSKTSKKGGRPQEHVCFIIRHGQAGTCSNLSKLRRTPPWAHSVTQDVVHRMTATVNPNLIGVGKGMGIIIKAGLHHWTWGVAFRRVLNCRDAEDSHKWLGFSILGVILKFEQNLQKGWKTTGARPLHHPSWCGSSQCRQYPHWVSVANHRLRSYCQIWQKPPKMVDGMLKTAENGA